MEPASGISINEPDESNKQQQQQQNDIRIYCIFSANPNQLVANSTRWFKDGRQLSNVLSEQQQANELLRRRQATSQEESESQLSESVTVSGYPVLTIRQASRKDAGLYDCQLANSVGFSERLATSESTRLEVNFRPTVQVQIYKFDPNNESNLQATTTVINNLSNHAISHLTNSTLQEQATLLQSSQLFDPSQEIVKSDSSFLLRCNVLEAQPNKVLRFRWFKTTTTSKLDTSNHPQTTLLTNLHNNNIADHDDDVAAAAAGRAGAKSSQNYISSGQLEEIQFQTTSLSVQQQQIILVGPLGANFTPTSYFCLAENALGAGQLSEQPARLQLSYLPGKFPPDGPN